MSVAVGEDVRRKVVAVFRSVHTLLYMLLCSCDHALPPG